MHPGVKSTQAYWTGLSDREGFQFPTVLTMREAYLICAYLWAVLLGAAAVTVLAVIFTQSWWLYLVAPVAVIALGTAGLGGFFRHRIRSGEDARRRRLLAEGKVDRLVLRSTLKRQGTR